MSPCCCSCSDPVRVRARCLAPAHLLFSFFPCGHRFAARVLRGRSCSVGVIGGSARPPSSPSWVLVERRPARRLVAGHRRITPAKESVGWEADFRRRPSTHPTPHSAGRRSAMSGVCRWGQLSADSPDTASVCGRRQGQLPALPPMRDLPPFHFYFLGCSIPTDERRYQYRSTTRKREGGKAGLRWLAGLSLDNAEVFLAGTACARRWSLPRGVELHVRMRCKRRWSFCLCLFVGCACST